MFRKNHLDARKVPSELSKRAEFPLGELLPEEQREGLQPEKEKDKKEEEILPEGAEELPPSSKKLPGSPQETVRPRIPGQTGESPDVPGYTKYGPTEQTGMSPEELKKKREELGVGKEEKEEEEGLPKRPTWRDIAKEKLKQFDPEAKAKERMEERYGPSEKLTEVANTLEEFAIDLANVDLEAARNYVMQQDLPEVMKERADRLFRGVRYAPGNPRANEAGEVPIGDQRIFQHALSQLKAISPKEIEKATEWLLEDPQGQEFFSKARDQYLIRNVMNMLKNTVLKQEGEGVIGLPRPEPRSRQQREKQKRVDTLQKQLEEGKITQEEFDKKLKSEVEKEKPEEKKKENQEEPRKSLVDDTTRKLNELQRKYNAGELSEEEYKNQRARILLRQGNRLNLRSKTGISTEGPGGEDWFPDYESGDTFPKMPPTKRKKRFPFHNKPMEDINSKGPSSHGLPVPDGKGPAGDDQWGLLAFKNQNTIRKTADNDIFECHNFGELTKGPWFTYTLFKRAYNKFKSGDIVVQFGKTPKDAFTYRRRFGSVKKAIINIDAALLPAIATVLDAQKKDAETKPVLPTKTRLPGKPTPDDTLHEIQTGKEPMSGVYGPHTSEYDKMPWQGNRDGFDRPRPRREQDLKRNVFPYEDQEISNQTKIFNKKLNLRKQSKFVTRNELEKCVQDEKKKDKKAEVGGYAAPVVETPEERAAKPEQDVPKPINWDPKRPVKQKRKRYDLNESQLYNQNEHADTPMVHYTSKLSLRKILSLNLKKKAFDFNVSIFDPLGQFVEETVLSAPSMEAAQMQAQEFVNKGYPGYSFQVTDPYQQTPKTLGITDISEWEPPVQGANKLSLQKKAIDPLFRNTLINTFRDILNESGEVTPATVDRASKGALQALQQAYPQLDTETLMQVAQDADTLLDTYNEPSNFTSNLKGARLL